MFGLENSAEEPAGAGRPPAPLCGPCDDLVEKALQFRQSAHLQQTLSCLKQATEMHLMDEHGAGASGAGVMLVLQLSQLRMTHDAETVLDRLISAGSGLNDVTAAILQASIRLGQGRFREASQLAAAGLTEARTLSADAPEQRTIVPVGHFVMTIVNFRLGDLQAAMRYARRLSQDALFGRLSLVGAEAAWIATQLVEIEEGAEAAAGARAAVIDGALRSYELFVSQPAAAPSLVGFALDSGDVEAAAQVVRVANVVAAKNPEVATLQVSAEHASSLLSKAHDGLLRASIQHADVWARALAIEDAGALLVAGSGDPDAGVRLLEQALTAYDAIGSSRDVARVKARLRNSGNQLHVCSSRSRSDSSRRFELTVTETQVADLVAQGLTNGQAANQLYLSRHTVAYHLKSIFGKLHLSSRGELIGLWARQALHGDAAG